MSGDIVEQIRRLKASPGKDMAILGSGTIISLFTDHGLIDEYQFMIDPVALPAGTVVFEGIKQKLDLQLTSSRVFKSGVGAWQAFIQNDLFDELWLWVQPVIVSQGEKLFADVGKKFSLRLSNSKTYQNGVVGLYYQKT